jgi:hypothetical protein
MEQERRKIERVRARLPVQWKMGAATTSGIIVNLSRLGCLIAGDFGVEKEQSLSLEIEAAPVMRIKLNGIVIRTLPGKGFAVRFKDLMGTDTGLLDLLVDLMKNRETQRPSYS